MGGGGLVVGVAKFFFYQPSIQEEDPKFFHLSIHVCCIAERVVLRLINVHLEFIS